ncbi:hypothetical protein [Thiocapsa sp. UBA6158]|uniref:hypothetical protein n=1 Tax=Thiocapsa sp. UBA6158 TaxID=1947692 RepID=UPI0025CDE27E|nr:hypothetical protein [Thiocapsa sp. UBA6158]
MSWLGIIVIGIIFLVLVVVFPRTILSVIGIILAGGGALYLGEVTAARKSAERQASIEMTANFNEADCTADTPLKIIIANRSRNSADVVAKVDWNVAVYRPGYSSNIVDYSFKSFSDGRIKTTSEWATPYSSDKILAAGEVVEWCFPLPALAVSAPPASLKYEVTHKQVMFR